MVIILASASERRQELLKRLTMDFKVEVSSYDENKVIFTGDIGKYATEIAFGKANDIVKKTDNKNAIIIGCDTIVSIDNMVIGKPKNKDDAYNILKKLSGNTHKVCTGVVLINTLSGKILKESVITTVKFSKLNDLEIYNYIESNEPMDKAGAYGIQGFGGTFVESINGCYYNVVGLPLNKLKSMLKQII